MIRSWADLVRLPNVFTVLADVAAAFLLVAGGPMPWPRFVAVLIAGVALYWMGMILNDVHDVEIDRRERPHRPLPSGRVSVGAAKAAAWGLSLVAFAAAFVAGMAPATDLVPAGTMLPVVVTLGLVVAIRLYNSDAKASAFGPPLMGACRFGSFLLGASPHYASFGDVPPVVWTFALAMGLYITGLTSVGRREAVGGDRTSINVGSLVTLIGLALLAFAPRTLVVGDGIDAKVDPRLMFPLAIAVIGYPLVLRIVRTAREPTPANVPTTIKGGILAIIPLVGAIAVLGAGPWGVGVFALMIPGYATAIRGRVT